MKKLFLALFFLSILFFTGGMVHAQSTGDPVCDGLTPGTKDWDQAGCGNAYPIIPEPTPDPSPGPASTTSQDGGSPPPPPGTLGVPLNNPVNASTPPTTIDGASGPTSSSAELAQCSSIKFQSLLDILIWIKCIIVVAIIPLIFALALVVFLWGVFRFIAASDSVKKEEGKKFIMAGLIGLFVMTSLWGIIKIVSTTFGFDSTVPALQTKSTTLPVPKN